jgi:hypothetical protein
MRKELLIKIKSLINEIPVPPPGRKIALVKTKLEEAALWLQDDLNDNNLKGD